MARNKRFTPRFTLEIDGLELQQEQLDAMTNEILKEACERVLRCSACGDFDQFGQFDNWVSFTQHSKTGFTLPPAEA